MGGRLDSIRGGVGGTGYLVGARMKTGCGVVEYARGRLTGTVDRIGGAPAEISYFFFHVGGRVGKFHAGGCRHTGGFGLIIAWLAWLLVVIVHKMSPF